MSFVNYVSIYWGTLLVVGAMFLLIRINVFTMLDMRVKLYQMLLLILTLSVVSYVEVSLGNAVEYSPLRAVFTMLKYSISPVMMALMVVLVYDKRKKYIYIPAFINMVICIVSIKTGIVFSFDEELNSFHRGPLGYMPFIVDGWYVIAFVYTYIFDKEQSRTKDRLVVYYMAASAVTIMVFPIVYSFGTNESWFSLTIAINVFIYYVFVIQQLTQRDPLTGLLNRQSYYYMLEHEDDDITAVIAIDMNGLKMLNDEKGHEAGDLALSTIGGCILKSMNAYSSGFRVGGDEFMVLCKDRKRADGNEIMNKIVDALAATEYNCSVGCSSYAKGKTVDEMIKEADSIMYADKDRYYAEFGERKLHK